MKKIFSILFVLVLLNSCSSDSKKTEVETITPKTEELVATINYDVIGKLPHDLTAFTEGLLFHNNQIFESTGAPADQPQYKTVIGILDTIKGKINPKINIGRDFFGEGIVILNDKIYQLTYKNQICYMYDAKTYKQIGQFPFKNKEGWGMTTDGTSIILSDGTNLLTYWDPKTLKEIKTIYVTNGGYPENALNELEYVDGYIYANVWTKNYIVKIDLKSGKVVGVMDCSELTNEAHKLNPEADVLNGIAYDSATKRMFITGKMFPSIYVIKLRSL